MGGFVFFSQATAEHVFPPRHADGVLPVDVHCRCVRSSAKRAGPNTAGRDGMGSLSRISSPRPPAMQRLTSSPVTLIIAPKTVELHVSAVLAKLGVSSRREVPAAARGIELGVWAPNIGV
jgi:hypothetical protein